MEESPDSYRLDLDPEQLRLYGGHINTRLLTLRRATESEASSLSPSTPDSIILYKSYIESGLKLPLTPLVRGILAYFDIAPCQVNPNFYRAISVASAAIPHLSPDLVLTPDLFANCYKLGFCRRSGNGTPLGLFVISRHLDVAVPGWSLPRSEERWMHDPFVATGKSWQGQSRSPQIRCEPNRCVDFVRPPPLLSGKCATAFELMRRGRNSAFEKFLKRSVAQEDGVGTSPSPPETVGKRRKLSRVSSDKELPSHAPATPTIEKPKIRRGILQCKRKAQEDETKANYQPTLARNSKPSDAASAPKIPSSITVFKTDSGLTRRQIGQRRRYARKKQSNTIKESKPKGKPTIVASPSSTKLPPISALETALKEKGMIVASQSSMIPTPLTSNTEPHKPTGATIPIERYEAVLPSVPNCPDSPNTQTDLLTPVSILIQNSSTSLNDQKTIPPLELPSHTSAIVGLQSTEDTSPSKHEITQQKMKAKETELKASSPPTHATDTKPFGAASAPKMPSSITLSKVDSGHSRRQIGQIRRRTRYRQSNTIIDSEQKGKAAVVASSSSTKLLPTSVLETASKGKEMFFSSPPSKLLPPLTSNTEPLRPSSGAKIPIERYAVVLPSIPNSPISPNAQTDLLTPVSILTQSSSVSVNEQTTIPLTEVPSHAPAIAALEPTRTRPSSQRIIAQREKKAKENENKAKSQATHATIVIPSAAASVPQIPPSITNLAADSGVLRRQIGQRRRRAREKQSNTNIESEPVVVASPPSLKLPPTSTTETACNGKDKFVASPSSLILPPLTSTTQPYGPAGATIPIQRYEVPLPFIPNCPVSSNSETDVPTPMGSANRSEDEPTQGLHFEPSPTCPPKCPSQLLKSQPKLQAATDTILAIPFVQQETPVIEANSIIECPAAATKDVGKFRLPQDVELEGIDIDGTSTDAIFTRAMALFELGAKRLREKHKSACSSDGLREENERLNAEVERLKQQCSEVRQLKDQLNAEKALVERQLGATMSKYSSQAIAIASLRAENDELHQALDRARTEITVKNLDVRDLQRLKLENQVLKTDVEGLRKQCSELKTQTGIDACEVQRPENQLNAERVKRELGETRNLVFSQTATIADLRAEKDELSRLLDQSREEIAAQSPVVRELQGLKEENKELKSEVGGLTRVYSELKAQKDSALSEFERELGEARTKVSSQATAITDMCAEKGELTRLLEQSRDEIAAKNSVVGELQASITKLEGKVASSMQRESIIKTLRDSALLADQLADADVKRSRQAGYNDGLIDGRRIGWKEFAELQKGEPFQPESSIHSPAATQAGPIHSPAATQAGPSSVPPQ